MVPLTSLWMPILVAAVLVFVASFILHMVLPLHRNDWRTVPKQDDVMAAMRPFNIPPGDYMMPCGGGPESMKDPEFIARMKAGPVVLMTVMPNGMMSMGPMLVQWFLFCVVVSIFAAYLTSRAIGPGADYLSAFRFAGTVAFAGYALALIENSIWFRRQWSTTLKGVFDGLVYALLTGGAFGWLWPQ
jgi:hypothetical protein